MSRDGRYHIYVRAPGVANKRQLVEACHDPELEGSLISEHKAQEIKATIKKLSVPKRLKGAGNRTYICHGETMLSWYVAGKEERSPPKETFYVFEDDQGDFAIRLRASIEPSFGDDEGEQIAELQVLQGEPRTTKDKEEQEKFEKNRNENIQNTQTPHDADLFKQYRDQKSRGGSNGQPAGAATGTAPRR